MLIFLFSFIHVNSLPVNQSTPISRIAFGSCTNQFNGNNPEIYYSITSSHPDLFLFIGDAIYADVFRFPFRYPNPNLAAWSHKYSSLKLSPEFRQLTSKTMISGVWDDHDYGINNGGSSFSMKHIAKSFYLDFLNDGSNRDHEGIYHSFSFKDLKVILIDIRWFREDDPNGDSLGEEQWAWLEEQMRSKEKVKIIANGLQVNTFDRVGPAEKWHDRSRERLWELVSRNHGVILLSGDVHYSEIMKVGCSNYWIYEFTSSGMAHTVYTIYYLAGWAVLNIFQGFNFNIGPKVLEKNFGLLTIDWEKEEIELFSKDSFGNILNQVRFKIQELYERKEVDEICKASVFRLRYSHFAAACLVFIFPLFTSGLSLLVFLRKHSNSY